MLLRWRQSRLALRCCPCVQSRPFRHSGRVGSRWAIRAFGHRGNLQWRPVGNGGPVVSPPSLVAQRQAGHGGIGARARAGVGVPWNGRSHATGDRSGGIGSHSRSRYPCSTAEGYFMHHVAGPYRSPWTRTVSARFVKPSRGSSTWLEIVSLPRCHHSVEARAWCATPHLRKEGELCRRTSRVPAGRRPGYGSAQVSGRVRYTYTIRTRCSETSTFFGQHGAARA